MPDTPIPIASLPAATLPLSGPELTVVEQSGTTKNAPASAIAALAAGGVTGVGLSGTPRTGTIVLAPGANLTITESPTGTFTFAAAAGASPTPVTWNTPVGGTASHPGNGQWEVQASSGNNLHGDQSVTLNIGDTVELTASIFAAGGTPLLGMGLYDNTFGVFGVQLESSASDAVWEINANGTKTSLIIAATDAGQVRLTIARLGDNTWLVTGFANGAGASYVLTTTGLAALTTFYPGALTTTTGGQAVTMQQFQFLRTTGN